MEEHGRVKLTTGDTKRRLCSACLVTKITDTHSECVLLIAFVWQQLLRERGSMLRLYLHCLSCRMSVSFIIVWLFSTLSNCHIGAKRRQYLNICKATLLLLLLLLLLLHFIFNFNLFLFLLFIYLFIIYLFIFAHTNTSIAAASVILFENMHKRILEHHLQA